MVCIKSLLVLLFCVIGNCCNIVVANQEFALQILVR